MRVLPPCLVLWLACLLGISDPTRADEEQNLSYLVQAIETTNDEQIRERLLRGMVDGLAGRRDLPSPDGWPELRAKLRESGNAGVRDLADRLSQVFGDRGALESALRVLLDENAEPGARLKALRSLTTQRYKPLVIHLETLLSVPELRVEVIRAFGMATGTDPAKLLVAKYPQFDAAAKRAVVETLATRKSSALVLVSALKNNEIEKEAIPSYLARSLRDLVGPPFSDVYGEVADLGKDTKQLIAKYKRMITPDAIAAANASRGRIVFEKTCGACHQMYGEGGKIGPDLTGSNRANLDYFLLNSLNPSDDVPEGYRMVIIQTDDGRVWNGVIGAEDNQRVVLKTVDRPEVIIPKADIERRKVSEKSMMPDGQLQEMKPQQIFDLVKYLRTTSQVDLP